MINIDILKQSKLKKILIIFLVVFVFFYSLIINMPTWIVGNIINSYSKERFKLYNQEGNFWDGNGLLVHNSKQNISTPLLLINWKLKLGLKNFVTLNFFTGNKQIGNMYINKNGVNLDDVDLSLSIMQVSQIFDLIKNLGLSGNLHIASNHLLLSNKNFGEAKITMNDLSSQISPVNPLGSYIINYDFFNENISVNSFGNPLLAIKGNGDAKHLTLNAKVDPDRKEQMIQFMTAFGFPNNDGSYDLKLY